MSEARIHSLPEALARLASPYATEELATLTGEGVLVVDLPAEDTPALAGGAGERAAERLLELPCPTVALRPARLPGGVERLARAFDLWIERPGDLEGVLEPMRRNPQASLALVQLLRHNEGRSIHDGLIAESLVYATLQAGAEFAKWRAARVARTVPTPDEPAVLTSRDGPRLEIAFNRPDRHNAFGVALRDGLVEALQLAASDESIREIVLCGRGPSFCSGGDLDEFGSLPDPATAHAIRSTRNPGRLLADVADRARAEVHGACIGAGVELPRVRPARARAGRGVLPAARAVDGPRAGRRRHRQSAAPDRTSAHRLDGDHGGPGGGGRRARVGPDRRDRLVGRSRPRQPARPLHWPAGTRDARRSRDRGGLGA